VARTQVTGLLTLVIRQRFSISMTRSLKALPAPRDDQSLALGVCNSWVVLDFVLQMVFPDFKIGVHSLGTDFDCRSIARVAINVASGQLAR